MKTDKKIEELAPKEIYLQVFTDDGYAYKDAGEEVTWCEDRVSDKDVKYVRDDEVQKQVEEARRDGYRRGYFDSGVRPTEDEVKKFEGCYFTYLQTLKENKE